METAKISNLNELLNNNSLFSLTTDNYMVELAVANEQLGDSSENLKEQNKLDLPHLDTSFDEAYYLTDGIEFIAGGDKREMILALDGNDVILGMGGNDFINGNKSQDLLNGNEGNDTIHGGQGNDIIWGGKDNDLLLGDKDEDTIFGDLGDDEIYGGDGSDLLFGGGENDVINGNLGDDTVSGGLGNDMLFGGQNNDILIGYDGSDTLFGDKGSDTLFGGQGSDRFVLGRGTGGPREADADWIFDFHPGQDYIQLTDGLTYNELKIYNGTGRYQGYTIIQNAFSGEYLAIIPELDSSEFPRQYFIDNNSPPGSDLTGSNGSIGIHHPNDNLIDGGGNNPTDTIDGNNPTDTLNGNNPTDTISGSDNTDTISGSDNTDTISGSDNTDTLFGGDNTDTISGSDNTDTLFGGDNTDTISGSDNTDTISGSDNTDTLFGGDNTDTISGGGDNSDTISGSDNSDTISGGDNTDTISGSDNTDTISGIDNTDTISGSDNTDTLFGGDNTDTISGSDNTDTLFGGDNTDTISGGGDNSDTISGSDNTDTISGSDNTDTISGGDNTDTISGGDNTDTISGGDNTDTISGGDNTDTISGGDNTDTISGGDNTDTISGGDNTDTISGGDNTDTISGGDNTDTISGGDNTDTISGGDNTDTISGGDNTDTISGGDNTDTISGGDNTDTISGSDNTDTVSGGDNTDTISGGDNTDTISGGDNTDTISGGDNTDTISGGDNTDTISGGDNTDTISGGDNTDTISGGDNTDTISGGDNTDTISGSDNTDTVSGGDNTDTISGGDNTDTISGGDNTDTISGGDNTDTISGGDNTDTISGGDNTDTISGGDNTDTISGGDNTDTISGGDNTDTISGGDNTPAPVNQTPADIFLSNVAVAENSANGMAIGTLSVDDVDGDDTHTYSLVDDAEGRFVLEGDRLKVAASNLLNYETDTTHTIAVRVTDSAGNTFDKNFTIIVNDINETPAIGNPISNQNASAKNAFNYTIPANTFADPDGDNLTYSATLANGSALPAWLSFNPTTRTFSGTPTNQDAGNIDIKVTATDGNGSSISDIFAINITKVNSAPTTTNISITGNEDSNITFNAANFTSGFSDIDGDNIAKIKITELPTNGILKLNGNPVTVNQEINISNIGKLTFTPDANFNGTTSFTWNASDGKTYAATDAVGNITVNNVNDAPTITDLSVTTKQNTDIQFTAAKFTDNFSDIDGDSITKIKITGLPAYGTLKLSGAPVGLNQEINIANLNQLTFTPNTYFNGNTNFSWNASDSVAYATANAKANITVYYPDDRPGNTPLAAWNLGTLEGTRPVGDFVGTTDPLDYYKFTLDSRSNFRVMLDDLTANADLQLIDSTGKTVLQFSANTGTNADIITTPLNAGQYYLLVKGNSDTSYNLELSAQTITGPSYYVSETGSDNNAGTFNQPFRTIQKAADIAKAGDTIYIREGTYREGDIRTKSDGAAGKPITFTAYTNEDAVISGAEVITGWTKHNDQVYKAKMNWNLGEGNNQIFVNGKMMVEARWPNIPGDPTAITYKDNARSDSGSIDNYNAPANSQRIGTYLDSDLTQAAGFWNGAKINFTPGNNWYPQNGKIISSEPGKLDFDFTWRGPGENYGYTPDKQDAYYIWGTLKALDTAQEWYYDANTQELYLWAPNGDDPNNYVVEAKQRDRAFNLFGRSHVTLENLTVFGSRIHTNNKTSNLVIDGLEVLYGSHTQNIPYTLMSGGTPSIMIEGNNNIVRNSYVAYSAAGGIKVNSGTGNIVENNIVQNTAYAALNDAAIRGSGTNTQIIGNTAFNNGMAKVIDLYQMENGKALYNEVYNGGLQTSDGAGIFVFKTDGKRSEIAYNAVHDMLGPADWSLRHYGMTGIYLDRSYNFDVHHNVIWNNSDGSIKLLPRLERLNDTSIVTRIYNNTGTGHFWFRHNEGTMAGTEFKNNIFERFFGHINLTPYAVFENNIRMNTGTKPQFVNAANHDYRLQPNSPGIDTGKVLAPFTDDFTGTAPDIGAFELGQKAFLPGATILPEQIYNLDFQFNAPQNGKLSGTVTGLPLGRKLPQDFQIIIGNSTASGNFVSSYIDPNTNLAKVAFTDVELGNQKGTLPIYVQMGSNAPLELLQTITIS